MVHTAVTFLALAASVLCLVFIGGIAAAVYATSRRGRNGRQLAPVVRPVLRAKWPGRLDDLRDRIVAELRRSAPRVSASVAAFHRPAVAIFVNTARGTREATLLAVVGRDGRGGMRIEVRSGSAFRRPRRATCLEVLALLEAALRTVPGLADLDRGP